MTAEHLFSKSIVRIRRRLLRRAIYQCGLLSLLVGLGGYALVVVGGRFGWILLPRDLDLHLLLPAMSLAASIIYTVITRPSLLASLIDLDTRLNLHDRLSTAYEYQKTGHSSVFSEALFHDAERALRGMNQPQLFPLRFSRLYVALVVLIGLNLLLEFRGEQFFDRTSNDTSHPPRLLREPSLAKGDPTPQPSQDHALSQRLEALARKLEAQAFPPTELLGSVQDALQEIQGSAIQSAQEAGTAVENLPLEQRELRRVPHVPQLSRETADKLRELLRNMLDGQVPAFTIPGPNSPDLTGELDDLLALLLEDLDAKENERERPVQGNLPSAQDSPERQAGQPGEAEQDAQHGSETQEHLAETQQGTADQNLQGFTQEERERDRDFADENSAFSAGDEASDERRHSPYELETAQGPTLPDASRSDARDDYRIHIRSLTQIGNPTISETDILRSYQQEFESVLHKEEIPRNYREYIKQYFLMIGLRQREE